MLDGVLGPKRLCLLQRRTFEVNSQQMHFTISISARMWVFTGLCLALSWHIHSWRWRLASGVYSEVGDDIFCSYRCDVFQFMKCLWFSGAEQHYKRAAALEIRYSRGYCYTKSSDIDTVHSTVRPFQMKNPLKYTRYDREMLLEVDGSQTGIRLSSSYF